MNKNVRDELSLLDVRLCHQSLNDMKHLEEYKNVQKCLCDSCEQAKFNSLPFKLSNTIAIENFHILHVDLWRPYRVQATSCTRYVLTR